jgi:SAM-dependent methyltransferase
MASQERFGYEWDKYNKILPEYEAQFKKWVAPLTTEDFRGKKILDAGCGMGRNSYWALKYGAKSVLAFDFDHRSVNSSKKNLGKFRNAKVKYESIYDIKYENEFDIAFSIGVIQFLEDPHKAIENMVRSVKKGGLVLIWVYAHEGNEHIVRYISPIRFVTSRLPLKLTHIITYGFSLPLYAYIKAIPQKRPYMQQLSQFKFKPIHTIVFDQLIPRIAHYWKKEQVLDLYKGKGLKNIRIHKINDNSWTIIGEKE